MHRQNWVLVALASFLFFAVTGCQTTGLQYTFRHSDQYPDPNLVDVKIGDRGQIKFRTRDPYSRGLRRYRDAYRQTLSGVQAPNRKIRVLASMVTLIDPRDDVAPLGTVFRKQVRGFATEFDDAPARKLESLSMVEHIGAGLFRALILTQSVDMLIAPGPEAIKELREQVSDRDTGSFRSVAVQAVADDLRFEYLPAKVVEGLVTPIKEAGSFDPEALYFVVDKIVRASMVAYYFGPKTVHDSLDEDRFNNAVEGMSNVRKEGDVYVVTKGWATPKVIALGFSVVEATAVGRRTVSLGSGPIMAEVLLAQSTKVPGMVPLR